jgi:hypothetical protein
MVSNKDHTTKEWDMDNEELHDLYLEAYERTHYVTQHLALWQPASYPKYWKAWSVLNYLAVETDNDVD